MKKITRQEIQERMLEELSNIAFAKSGEVGIDEKLTAIKLLIDFVENAETLPEKASLSEGGVPQGRGE